MNDQLEPRDGIWLFEAAVITGGALLAVCAMVGVCVIIFSLA